MAYVPPLNGGRINASISGNTAGVGALISTGTMVLAGGNNVTLSQNGNSISIAGGGGSINFSAGASSANLASVTFANSNGVSFGLSNGTLTGSVAAQSAQTLGLYATGANTVGLSSSGTLDARNLNISGQGALSAGLSGSTLQLAAPAVSGVNAAGIVNISSNGSNVTISAPAFSAGIATSNTVSNQLILAGGNNITLSQSTNASGATVSIAGGGGSLSMYATGGTLNNTSAAFDARSLTFNGLGNISVGYSNGSIQISDGGTSTREYLRAEMHTKQIANLSANDHVKFDTVQTSAGSSISLDATTTYTNGAGASIGRFTLTAGKTYRLVANVPYASFSATESYLDYSWYSLTDGAQMGNVAGIQTSTRSSNDTHSGYAEVIISPVTTTVVEVRIMSTANLSAIGFSTSPQLMYPNVYIEVLSSGGSSSSSGATLSHWEYPTNAFASIGTLGQGSLSLQRVLIPSALAASAAKIGGSLSVGASAGNATGSANISLRMGVYSLTGSTLTLVASGSLNNAFSWQANTSASTAAAASLQGMRQLTTPLNATLAPGEYWVGALVSSAVTAPGATFSLYGNAQMATSPAVLSPIGSNSTAVTNNYNAIPFQGIYTATTGALPNSILRGDVNYTSASNMMLANFYHAMYNATY